MKFKDRIIYARITYDEETKKKKCFFGKEWGKLDKSEANARAIKTGFGLVVVDIDTKDLSEIDKKLRDMLKKCFVTIETARGFHYYFRDEKSDDFVNKSAYTELVDIRSDGGVVFDSYQGKSDNVSYNRVGAINEKMPKKMRAYLLKLMQVSKTKQKNRVQWERIDAGEIHDGCIRYALKDFQKGLTLDEVLENGLDYVMKYLKSDARENRLMMERIKWSFNTKSEEKLKNTQDHKEDGDVGGDFEEEEVLKMLQNAQKGGAMELQKVMLEIKKKLKLSMATMRTMLKETPIEPDGLNAHFKGELVFDSEMGVFVEVRPRTVKYYSKSNFSQTCMSKSGYLEPSDVTSLLCKIPHRYVIYNPTLAIGEVFNAEGEQCVNVFRAPVYSDKVTGKRKKWKMINKVLDNLFHNQPDAKEEFINWCAAIVQTGCKTGVAWGFFGASGTGKGLIIDVMAIVLGRQNCSLNVSDTDLNSTFNPYCHHVQLIHLNEIASDFHGRHGVAGKIKAMTTDNVLRMNQKGIGEIAIDNHANLILNSNKSNPLELDPDDRRWNMIIAQLALAMCDWWDGNNSYKKAISEAEEFGQYLRGYKADYMRAKTPMAMSFAKQSVIEQTSPILMIVAKAMREFDLDKMLELFDVDDTEIYFTEKLFKDCMETGKWSNTILNQIYMWATGKDSLKGYEVIKWFIKTCFGMKTTRWTEQNSTVRGLILTPP
jgi:hypothetical protein